MRERETVRPAFRIRNSSSANSRGLRSTTRSSCVTRRASGDEGAAAVGGGVAGLGAGARLDHAVPPRTKGFAQNPPQIAVVLPQQQLPAATLAREAMRGR